MAPGAFVLICISTLSVTVQTAAKPPKALWPLTDKHDNPVEDITGNGHNGVQHNLEKSSATFPGSKAHAYRFKGSRDSYVEIPNNGLNPTDFTVVMWIKPQVSAWGQLWGWDATGMYGTHLWQAETQLFFRPVGPVGQLYTARYQPGITIGTWAKVLVSYNSNTGIAQMCVDNNCRKQTTDSAGKPHRTDTVIRLGAHLGMNDNRVYTGEMACVAYYDSYFEDISGIDFDSLKQKCFTKSPEGLWPLTDKYDNPVQDITGHGHNGVKHNLEISSETFPGSTAHAYRFKGSRDSYVEIPNNGLNQKDFTVVMWIKPQVSAWGQLWGWDATGMYGTHLWQAETQLFFRPVGPVGQLYTARYQPGITIGTWAKVLVSYNSNTGIAHMCVDNNCRKQSTDSAGLPHRTDTVIRLGAHLGMNDNRVYTGEMACVAYYDSYFEDISEIDFVGLKQKCFDLCDNCEGEGGSALATA